MVYMLHIYVISRGGSVLAVGDDKLDMGNDELMLSCVVRRLLREGHAQEGS
jgi:hypothetical protein